MGQKQEGMGEMDKNDTFQDKSPSNQVPEMSKRNESYSKQTKKNTHSSSLEDDINLTNSMIVSESTDPNLDYDKLNCLGENQDTAVYRVKHKLTDDIRAMKIIKKKNKSR